MKNKKIIILLLLILCSLVVTFFFKDFFTTQTGNKYRNITDLENSYNADEEIAQALEQMQNSKEKAAVITHSNSGVRHIALTFDGLTDRTTIQQILDLLRKYDSKATFFVDGMQTAEDPQTVFNIKKAGHRIENYTFSGIDKMETLPADRMVKEFCRAKKIILVTTDQGPNLLKCNDTKYTEQLLIAAKASGFKSVVKSDVFVNFKQLNSLNAADDFVKQIRPGSIVSIKLKPNVDIINNEPGKSDLPPAIDKQPGLKELPQPAESGRKEIVSAVENLLIALQKANYTTVYVEDFAKSNITQKLTQGTNPQKGTNFANYEKEYSFFIKAAALIKDQIMTVFSCRTAYAAEIEDSNRKEIKMISTTEPAVSFTFGGLSNELAVSDVLERLNNLGIKATFFVAEAEAKKYPSTVLKIIENGHEIGIAIRPKDGATFEETYQTITRFRSTLETQFGVETNLVKQSWGAISDETKAAISAAGCHLIGQSVNVVQSKHKEYTSADQVMAEIFGKLSFSLARGQIVYFRMDYYTQNDRLVGDLVEKIKERKIDNIAYITPYDNPANNPANNSQYMIKPVGEILGNKSLIYHFPADPKDIPERLRTNVNRLSIDKHNFLSEASKRYIGNEEVTYEDRMLGFSKMDTRRLDKSGLIHTEDNVIFLTFDDWGTDASVNKILYVLRKHHVQGTFFVITNNVLNNPNLLRTIALEGHDIGSHSDKHKPMVVRDQKTGKLVKTQGREEYIKDVATAYQKLSDITGDIIVNGKPALTRFFRPPTLAVSKMGMESLFATGYEYIISGSCSTYDYKAKSVVELVNTIKEGVYTKDGKVKKGAILTMHMGDSCVYTPIALDILLTANEAKPDSDPSKFRVGRLSDYLPDGYSQINVKKSTKLNSHDKTGIID